MGLRTRTDVNHMSPSAIDASRTTIHGQFVNLRPLSVDDAARTLVWRSSPRAFLLNRGAQTLEEQHQWIASRPSSELNFVIELKDRKPVGMLSLIDIDLTHRRAESARFLIGDEASTAGLPVAAEAMKLLYHVAFERLTLTRVYGAVVEDNPLMLKWQLYVGIIFLIMVVFAPGGFSALIMLNLRRVKYGEWRKMRWPYAGMFVTGLIALWGFAAVVEMAYQVQVAAGSGSALTVARIPLDSANAGSWALAVAVLIAGGIAFEVSRRKFQRVWNAGEERIAEAIKKAEAAIV